MQTDGMRPPEPRRHVSTYKSPSAGATRSSYRSFPQLPDFPNALNLSSVSPREARETATCVTALLERVAETSALKFGNIASRSGVSVES